MKDSLKDAVDKQLAIAKLEEKLHITFGELDTPESKFKSLMDAVISMNTKLMLEALLALGANPNTTIELLKDESTPEEVKTEAKKNTGFPCWWSSNYRHHGDSNSHIRNIQR